MAEPVACLNKRGAMLSTSKAIAKISRSSYITCINHPSPLFPKQQPKALLYMLFSVSSTQAPSSATINGNSRPLHFHGPSDGCFLQFNSESSGWGWLAKRARHILWWQWRVWDHGWVYLCRKICSTHTTVHVTSCAFSAWQMGRW